MRTPALAWRAIGVALGLACSNEVRVQRIEERPVDDSAEVIFSSDWSTALGNSLDAVTDGGKWNDGPSSDYANSMEIVRRTGLNFPSEHVFKVTATVTRAGWVLNQTDRLPIPAVGESRYFRWYFRLDVPHQPQDPGTHPIQDGGAISQTNWSLWIDEMSDGRYWASFYTAGNNNVWTPTAALRKGQTYRMEVGYTRVSESSFELHLRIYHRQNGSDVLLFDDDGFRDARNGNRQLVGNNVIRFSNLDGTRVLNSGNNGIMSLASDVLYGYQGAFCVRTDDWCGAYE